jgi:hypothetical protein
MKKNIGKKDRFFRIIAGVIIIILSIFFNSWWGLLGFLPIITAIYSFCPLYKYLNVSTCKNLENINE